MSSDAEPDVEPDTEEHDVKRTKVETIAKVVSRCDLPLFVLCETLFCAATKSCISCAHKICFGMELPPRSKVNVRPELCPRALMPKTHYAAKQVGLYHKGCSVLTLGDGDLSFSRALVSTLGGDSLVATTFDSRDILKRSYPDSVEANIEALQNAGASVIHGVDATDLEHTLSLDRSFDFIVFNFPCIATGAEGEDAQSQVMDVNQAMLREFGTQTERFLKPSGEVHVTHKTKAAFKNWDIPQFVSAASNLQPRYTVVFDRCAYPGYINKKARDRKSFPASDAAIFVFSSSSSLGDVDTSTAFSGTHDELAAYCRMLKSRGVITVPCTDSLRDAIIAKTLL